MVTDNLVRVIQVKHKKTLRRIYLEIEPGCNLWINSYFSNIIDYSFVSDFSKDGRFLVIATTSDEINLIDIKSMRVIKKHTF